MDRGAWRATVHTIAKSQTWLKRLSMHTRETKVQEDTSLNELLNFETELVGFDF